ncbi:hypothetical protein [Streptomyces sp. NPDC002547]
MTAAPQPRIRLAQHIEHRITELALEYAEVCRRAEISDETLGKIRKGMNARGSTYLKLERALDWAQGSVAAILAGGEPTPLGMPAGERVGTKSEPSPLDQELELLRRAIAAMAKELGLSPDETDEAYRRARQDIERSHHGSAGGAVEQSPRRHRAV